MGKKEEKEEEEEEEEEKKEFPISQVPIFQVSARDTASIYCYVWIIQIQAGNWKDTLILFRAWTSVVILKYMCLK